jgi:hypothetical protein
MESMVIHVIGDGSTASQVRIYGEFRFFAALARYARRIRSLDVILRTVVGPETADIVTCANLSEARLNAQVESDNSRHARSASDRS